MKTIKTHILLFQFLLILSGITAFPLYTEAQILLRYKNSFSAFFHPWIDKVAESIFQTDPIILYGTDWLAFAHIVIALFFIPVWKDPRKYIVNIEMAMVACILVFPLAIVCGNIRQIPWYHQCIDACFGLFGFAYLYFIKYKIQTLK